MKKYFFALVVFTMSFVNTMAQQSKGKTTVVSSPKLSTNKPNILIIWGDDIGQFNVSTYNMGMMGYKTPNIDRIGKEGAVFTDWYGQQSCTAGRAAFITGQSPIRTGLLKIGMPGGKDGLNTLDPTLAELLKPLGYKTGQFGKNHLGDMDQHLPTNHGFDEFFGNLYHLNAEEEPENVDYPKDPEFKKKFGPRGVIHSFAGGRIEDTGPLTKKRMETIDGEVTDKAMAFLEAAKKEDKPFFMWYNTTRMHINTHLKPESQGKTGYGVYADGMVEHDFMVGQVLAKLKALGLEENTIVMYSTDNGNEFYGWPDGGSSFFRGEKNTQWEGGFRVPCVIRWPGVIKPGTLINDFAAHEDMIPTLLAAAGQPNVKQELLNGKSIGGKNYKVHLDGYNLLPALKDGSEWPRKEFIYWTDGGEVAALRYKDWKVTYLRQDAVGMNVWVMPFTVLRAPMITNLKMDPFERAFDESTGYNHWLNERMYILTPATSFVAGWMESFKQFPPRMKPGSFGLDRVMEAAIGGKK